MKISCDVIKDILPLYAEDMVSNDTKDLVEEHICDCQDCKGELESICKAAKVPVDADARAMKRVEKRIRRKKQYTVLTVLFLVLTMVVSLFVLTSVPIYLTYDEAVADVQILQDGKVLITKTDAVTGGMGTGVSIYSTGYQWNWLYKLSGLGAEYYSLRNESWAYDSRGEDFYYFGVLANDENVLLYDAPGRSSLDWCYKRVRYDTVYVFWITLALGFCMVLLALVLRKRKSGRFFEAMGILCLCIVAAIYFVTAGRMLHDYDPQYYLVDFLIRYVSIGLLALFGWGTIQSVVALVRLRKTEA